MSEDKNQLRNNGPENLDNLTENGENIENLETGSGSSKNRKKNKKMSEKLKSKKFKYGSMSTLFVVGVLVLAVLLNVIASALVDRFPSLSLDMTTDKRMTMSDKLTEIVSGVNEKVEIIFLTTEDTLESTWGSEGAYLTQQVAKMAEANSNISVTYVDLEKNPSYVKDYEDSENLDDNSIIVKSEKRHRVIAIDGGIIQYDSSSGEVSNNSEMLFATALNAVTKDKLPVIAFASGNGEQAGTEWQAYLTNNGFECRTVNLTTEEVPQDADVLVLHCPTTDLTDAQIQSLDDFLSNDSTYGKNLIVTFMPSQANLPKLNALLNEWGINMISDGSYIVESDSSRSVSGTQGLVPVLEKNTEDDSILSGLANNSNLVLGYAPVPMEVISDSEYGLDVQTLLYTYDTAYMVPDDADENWEPGSEDYKSYPVLTNSRKAISIDGEYRTSNVTVCAAATIFDPDILASSIIGSILSQSNLLNKDVLMDVLRDNTGTTEEENIVYIESTDVGATNMTMTATQVQIVGLWIFVILVPLAVIIAGIVVWIRRRHL